MEMTMNYNLFQELTFDEMFTIDGGINWGSVFTGVAIVGGTLLAIVSLPVTAPVGICVAGVVCCGAAAGYFIGSGLKGR